MIIYPEILVEIPGVVLESDFEDNDDAVTTPTPPAYAEQAVAALSNAAISKCIGMDGQSTGVARSLAGVYGVEFSHIVPEITRGEPNVEWLTRSHYPKYVPALLLRRPGKQALRLGLVPIRMPQD